MALTNHIKLDSEELLAELRERILCLATVAEQVQYIQNSVNHSTEIK